jgi:hypothetical protein
MFNCDVSQTLFAINRAADSLKIISINKASGSIKIHIITPLTLSYTPAKLTEPRSVSSFQPSASVGTPNNSMLDYEPIETGSGLQFKLTTQIYRLVNKEMG